MAELNGGATTHRHWMSIAEKDKMLLHLQEQADYKKTQLKEDYRRLKADVKENPYLQVALDYYDNYFALQQQQLAALEKLLKTVDTPSDQKLFKKELAALEKNLP
jgi:hypothetical protein